MSKKYSFPGDPKNPILNKKFSGPNSGTRAPQIRALRLRIASSVQGIKPKKKTNIYFISQMGLLGYALARQVNIYLQNKM